MTFPASICWLPCARLSALARQPSRDRLTWRTCGHGGGMEDLRPGDPYGWRVASSSIGGALASSIHDRAAPLD